MNSLNSKLSNRVNQLYQIGRIEMWRKSPEQKYGRYAGFEAGIWSRFWIGSQICLNFWARTKIDRDSDILHYFSKEGIFEGRKSNFDSLYRSVNVKKEKRKGKEFSKKADLQRKEQEINGLGFFPVNGLGLNLSNFSGEKAVKRLKW